MALNRVHLRKLLKILFLEPNARRSALRSDIREEIAREAGQDEGGGDFYAPFWADAKSHVFGMVDLHAMVDDRVGANGRRANLYPQLRAGFLTDRVPRGGVDSDGSAAGRTRAFHIAL